MLYLFLCYPILYKLILPSKIDVGDLILSHMITVIYDWCYCIPGAVAGIADQPLQTLTQLDDPDEAPSTAWAATNIVTGVGKGLVGMVTKPIGGAAEFVSQTGMGLLQGTGLSRFPKQHHPVVDKDLSTFHNGRVKFTQ